MTHENTQLNDDDMALLSKRNGVRFFTKTGKHFARTSVITTLVDLAYMEAPLTEGILRAAIDSPSRKVQTILLSIRVWLISGHPLSQALTRQGSLFSKQQIELVQSGEEYGRLHESLAELETLNQSNQDFYSEFRGYTAYFFSVLTLQVFFITSTIVLVAPQFQKIGNDIGIDYDFYSNFSELLLDHTARWTMLTPIIMIVLLLCLIAGPDTVLRWLRLKKIVFNLPGLAGINRTYQWGHVTSVLGRFLSTGYPTTEALQNTAQLELNSGIRKSLTRIEKRVQEGDTLAQAVGSEGSSIPNDVATTIKLAEPGGNIGEFLLNLSEKYKRTALQQARTALYIGSALSVILTGFITWVVCATFYTMIMQLGSIG